MYGDFNRIVVQLVQHPVMHKPLSDLTYTECELAYALIRELIDLSTEGDYTLLDYIQMARLEYYLGELSCKINCSREETALHYAGALHLLEKGGFDLNIKKWVELVSLRIENSKKEWHSDFVYRIWSVSTQYLSGIYIWNSQPLEQVF